MNALLTSIYRRHLELSIVTTSLATPWFSRRSTVYSYELQANTYIPVQRALQ